MIQANLKKKKLIREGTESWKRLKKSSRSSPSLWQVEQDLGEGGSLWTLWSQLAEKWDD